MTNFVIYLLLGLGAGSAYALLANGIVSTFKGSGILNFAQGGIAMFAAYVYLALINAGLEKFLALLITAVGAAAFGSLVAVGIVRPLRNAPVLARVVATFGLLTGLEGLAALIWGNQTNLVPSLFPTRGIKIFGGAHVGEDRLFLFAVAVVICILLWALFRFTRIGLATQAASSNERGAALLGFSPTRVAAVNWALGSALAAVAGAMIAPLTGLDEATLPLVVVPALAAALVGRFSSFGITTATAIAIGCVQSEILNLWPQQGIESAAPFVIVIAVMVIAGRGIPARGNVREGRPPTAAPGLVRPVTFVLAVAAAIVLLAVFNSTYQSAMATSLTMAVVVLSLVVVTGYVGQVSLMQMTFVGLGAFFTAKLAFNLGIPFPFPIILGAVIVAPIGVLLGLPALRVRGMGLAVLTLGAAVAVDAIVFQNPTWAGGITGVQAPSPKLAGFSLDPFAHPMRYGMLCLVTLIITALLVSNLRRGALGRRMLAVRGNERAAAVAGVNVAGVKLQAFMIAAILGAIGGGLLAYSNPFTEFSAGEFAAVPSITLITIAYIGGIASISGAVVAGIVAPGGVVYVWLTGALGSGGNWYVLISGVGLVWTVIQQPDGVAIFNQRLAQQLMARIRGRGAGGPGQPPPQPESRTAEITEPANVGAV
jgi:branched-chain amino acid transport system permease protein